MESIRLTQWSIGAGCGCKIAPATLQSILGNHLTQPDDKKLIVGNHTGDDAAVYDIGNGQCLVSTTDFFTPMSLSILEELLQPMPSVMFMPWVLHLFLL
jgi:selenide,water dikinase